MLPPTAAPAEGRICLDILNMPPKGAWKPSLNVCTVLASIGLLLAEPNPEDGLVTDVVGHPPPRPCAGQHACPALRVLPAGLPTPPPPAPPVLTKPTASPACWWATPGTCPRAAMPHA